MEEKRAALNKKYCETFTQPVLCSRCRFRCFARRGSARYQNFPATIHLQSFTFKEGLGRHHRLQIDNDLRSALESENL